MQEIVEFVSVAMAGGVVGNTTHDGLKAILGSSFDKLSSFLSSTNKITRTRPTHHLISYLLFSLTMKKQSLRVRWRCCWSRMKS